MAHHPRVIRNTLGALEEGMAELQIEVNENLWFDLDKVIVARRHRNRQRVVRDWQTFR